MLQHYLQLERETQLRDYDAMIAHITITMSRYIFLSFEQRCHDDPRTLGRLFFAGSEEMRDLSLALKKIRSTGVVAEDAILALVDALMDSALELRQIGQSCYH